MKLQNYSTVFMTETQNGFRKGRSCTDATFCLKLLIEKRREFNLETHLLFIDYEKAFDNIKRQILFNILKTRHIPDTLLKARVDIYTQNKILIKFNSKLSKPVEINKGVRQGCPLSPTLFNIYLDDILTKWQKHDITGIKLSKNQQLSTLLFADDQVVIADTEDNLQKAAHKLNCLITQYGLTISVQKTKSMAFKGRDPVRTKIVIDNKIIEQVNMFNYLGNMISYEKELGIDNKLHNYLKITGILKNVFKPQTTLKKTRLKLYNTLALPVLLYGSESWTIKARDARRITAAEMKYMRRTAGYTLTDHKTNTQITKELKITPILDKLQEYKRNWIYHVNRMPRSRLPRVMKQYSPTGRRNNGRPLNRLLDA